jgi:hypothetical protein
LQRIQVFWNTLLYYYHIFSGTETANELARRGSASGFMRPEPALGSLDRFSRIRLVAGWGTSTGGVGRTSVIPSDRLRS